MEEKLARIVHDSASHRTVVRNLLRALLTAVSVGVPYAAGSLLAFSWFNAGGLGATFFPAAGVTLAALLLLERRWWVAALAGAAVAEVLLDRAHDLSWQASAGFALANTVEPLVGATAVILLVGRPLLARPRDLIGFGVGGAVLGPACGAVIGATTFAITENGDWLQFAGEWWLGDGLGALIVGTALISLVSRDQRKDIGSRLPAVSVMLVASIVSTAVVFWGEVLIVAFLPIALLLIVAFRLGTRAVAVIGACVAFIAAHATAGGHVFWEALDASPTEGLVYLQLALVFVVGTPLLLSAALHSRDDAVAELAVTAKRAALVEATTALSSTTTLRQTIDVLLRHGASPFSATEATVAIMNGHHLRLHRASERATTSVEDGVMRGAVERHARQTCEMGDGTLAVVPFPQLTAGPRGAIGLVFSGTRRLAGTEWQRLEALAELAAHAIGRSLLLERESDARRRAEVLAMERARLVEIERAERTRAERAEDRMHRLHRFIEALTAAATGDLSRRIIEEIRVATEADWVGYVETTDPQRVIVSDSVGDRPEIGIDGLLDREQAQIALAASEKKARTTVIDGVTSVSIPLLGQATSFGFVQLVTRVDEALSDEDGERAGFFGSLGRQAGLALERAQLLRAEARARGRAEFMTTILSELESLRGFERRASRLVELLVPRVADFVSVEQPTDDENPVLALAHADPARNASLRELRLRHRLPSEHPDSIAQALAGRGRLLPPMGAASVARRDVSDPLTQGLLEELGPQSVIIVPLPAGEKVIGAMMVGLTDPDRRPYDEGDLEFIRELGARVGTVLENARLEEEDNRTALRLQQALLPGALPEVPGISSAGLYEAAQEGLEVGGDWFDVIDVGDGSVAIVVGDVVGHGLESAVTMGRLRTAVAAFAMSEREPDAVLDRLEEFAETSAGAHFGTVAYALLDASTGRVRYSLAGHLPPLVIAPDGTTALLDGGRSTPLCALGQRPRPVAEVTLEPGSTIVLYTDGLVEKRGTSIDLRLAQLEAQATAAAALDPLSLCDRLLQSLTEGRPTDDVAILAVRLERVVAATMIHRFPAEPLELAGARGVLRSWLSTLDFDEAAQREIVLGVGEALGNAVEHAYAGRPPGEVELTASSLDAEIEIAVRDWGSWRRRQSVDERGRGLPIMRTVFDSLEVDRRVGGTTVTLARSPNRAHPR